MAILTKGSTRLIGLICFYLAGCQSSHAELITIMSAGAGLGESNTQGDYSQTLTGSIFTLGYEYDGDRGLFLGRGVSSIHNDFKQLDLVFGVGNRYLKIGTGFIGLQSSIPTNPRHLFDTSGHHATNTQRRIDLSVTTIPLYLRIKPFSFPNFVVTIDGYYGLESRGSMTFPFLETRSGQYATVSSEPKRQGGSRGYAVAATWRLAHPLLAISLEYQYREAEMVKRTSYIERDILHILGQVTTPALTFQNRSLLLKLVLVK